MLIRTYQIDQTITSNHMQYNAWGVCDIDGYGCFVFEQDPSSIGSNYSSCPHIELTWQHAAREVTQESRRRVRVFWTSDLEYHLSVEIFHHSLKTVDWSYIEYHITGITDASRRRIGRCYRLASSSIPWIRSWSSTLRRKWVLTARDFSLSSICSY